MLGLYRLIIMCFVSLSLPGIGPNKLIADQPTLLKSGDRSPVDVALGPTESWLAIANQTSNSVSLLDLSTRTVVDEIAVGSRPEAIVSIPHSNHVLVSCSRSGQLYRLSVSNQQLQLEQVIALGFHPHGIAVTADGQRAFVALTDADQVALVDLVQNRVQQRIDVGRWPRYLALSPDDRRLVVGTSGDRGISIVDVTRQQLVHIDRFVGLNIGQMQLSADGESVYFPWVVYRRNPITERNIQQGWVLASRLGRIGFADDARREAISLDPAGAAVSDPHGLALTNDGQWAVMSAGGTHELILLRLAGLPFQDRGSTDHIDIELRSDPERFARIELGGRPLGLRITADSRTAFVANYLNNSVQMVDLSERRVVQQIDVGHEQQPSLARQGEMIFFDGRRSLDQWYSCHTCHYEGGANAVVMDTQNDGSPFTYKTVPPLYELDQTGPWTWHGWQKDLQESLTHSLKTTMLGDPPTAADSRALQAYFSQLRAPVNPWQQQVQSDPESELSKAVQRGREIFEGASGGCVDCHPSPLYTDREIHDLGTGDSADFYNGFNTPSLLGVFRRVVLMHDGRVSELSELLTGPHAPENVSGQKLSAAQLRDLIEFIKTLSP